MFYLYAARAARGLGDGFAAIILSRLGKVGISEEAVLRPASSLRLAL
jgi:hypothetical protein